MAIVNERHTSARPVQVDPKTGKPLPPTVPPRSSSPSLSTDGSDGTSGFFGSFFASKNKKKMAAMEPPPPTLKASGTLSEKETQEVEVIKLLITSYFNIVRRTMIDMVPKAIMLTLVQYVSLFLLLFEPPTLQNMKDCPLTFACVCALRLDSQRMKCNANSWSKCTVRRNSTICSRRATTQCADARSASRWSRVWARPTRLSVRCSSRFFFQNAAGVVVVVVVVVVVEKVVVAFYR